MTNDEFQRAVALHYDQKGAPTVLATGEGEIARLIKEALRQLAFLSSKIPS